MKKTLLSFLVFFFFSTLPIHAENIAEAPSPDPMSEEAITFLLSENMYQGTLSWQGNKLLPNLITK